MEFRSGSATELRSGTSAEFASGSVQSGVGQAVDVEADLDPPTFADVAYTAGSTVLNLECTTDREASVRWRCRRLLDGAMVGPWFAADSTPTDTEHAAQIAGLAPSCDWQTYIAIDATDDPDAEWQQFTDGMLGPIFRTLAKGLPNPDDQNDPGGGE